MSSLGSCLRQVVAFESLDDIGCKFGLIIRSPGEQCDFCFPKIKVGGNKIHYFPVIKVICYIGKQNKSKGKIIMSCRKKRKQNCKYNKNLNKKK